MTHLKALAAALVAALCLPALAVGQSAQQADVNADGVLSITEVRTAYPDVTEDQFIIADVNGDGLLEDTEVKAAQETGLLPTG